MEPKHHTNTTVPELASIGGIARAAQLPAERRSTIARLAAQARWHPEQAQAAREKAQEQAYLIQQILSGKQLPLV